jgi:alkylhydroperoxidase family enzyme
MLYMAKCPASLAGASHDIYLKAKLKTSSERKPDMGVPKPLVKDQADASIRELFEGMQATLGKMPNLFGVMARFPAALKRFVPFYNAVMLKGQVPHKLKELAYLKTASINVCQY